MAFDRLTLKTGFFTAITFIVGVLLAIKSDYLMEIVKIMIGPIPLGLIIGAVLIWLSFEIVRRNLN